MLSNLEKIENGKVILTFQVSKEDFKEAVFQTYLKTKEQYPIAGMQKGMAPKCVIEEQYGDNIFYSDTVNYLIDEEFKTMNNTFNNCKLKRENTKEINLLQIGKDKDLVFELLVNC